MTLRHNLLIARCLNYRALDIHTSTQIAVLRVVFKLLQEACDSLLGSHVENNDEYLTYYFLCIHEEVVVFIDLLITGSESVARDF